MQGKPAHPLLATQGTGRAAWTGLGHPNWGAPCPCPGHSSDGGGGVPLQTTPGPHFSAFTRLHSLESGTVSADTSCDSPGSSTCCTNVIASERPDILQTF